MLLAGGIPGICLAQKLISLGFARINQRAYQKWGRTKKAKMVRSKMAQIPLMCKHHLLRGSIPSEGELAAQKMEFLRNLQSPLSTCRLTGKCFETTASK
jgi:hypothetical protein